MNHINVLLVDDHEIVRRGLGDLLQGDGDIIVVASVGTVAEGRTAARRTTPDVAVLDVRLPDGTGLELCAELAIADPPVRCIMLTSFADDHALVEAAEAGASAYLLKELRSTDIADAVRRVADGAQLLDAAEVRLAKRRISDSDEGVLDDLTTQEQKIFDLIGAGYSNRQIADELFLAEKTIKNHITNLLAKLGMTRRTEAAALAARIQERHRRRFD